MNPFFFLGVEVFSALLMFAEGFSRGDTRILHFLVAVVVVSAILGIVSVMRGESNELS